MKVTTGKKRIEGRNGGIMPSWDILLGLVIVSLFGFWEGACSMMVRYTSQGYPVEKISNDRFKSEGSLIIATFCFFLMIIVGFLLIYGMNN